MLTKCHKKEWMDFAVSHLQWTLEDWKRVVWSDETKVNRLGSDGKKWVWKRLGEPLSDRLVQGTRKFGGGSVMVWGCKTWKGAGLACKIDGIMDSDLYCNILGDELQGTLDYYGKSTSDVIFQQDGDPKHTSKKTMNSKSCDGLPNLQTSIPLSTYGIISNPGWGSMGSLQIAFKHCGRGFRWSGTRYQQRCVRI